MRRIHPVLILLVLALFAAGGCYTVLHHPQAYESTDGHYADKACADCHADADLYHYTEGYGGSWYYTYPPSWAYYYQSPWWYGDYWYYEPSHDGPAAPTESGRHLWNRGGASAPEFLPGQGEQIKVPSNTIKPGETTGNSDEKPAKKKKPKKRSLWGR